METHLSKTVQLAREAGMTGLEAGGLFDNFLVFEALVRADERALAAPVQQKPLFADIIAQHPGLAEELKAMDAAPVQEPVAIALNTGTKQGVKWLKNVEHGENLYTTPPAQRTWVDLSEQDKYDCLSAGNNNGWIGVMETTAAKLKEKNT